MTTRHGQFLGAPEAAHSPRAAVTPRASTTRHSTTAPTAADARGVGEGETARRRPGQVLGIRTAAGAILLAVVYCLVQVLTVKLRFPPLQRATIWTAGAVVLSALLVVGPGKWPVYLAAAAGAAFLVHFNDPTARMSLPVALLMLPIYLGGVAAAAWCLLRTRRPPYVFEAQSLAVLALVALIILPASTALAAPLRETLVAGRGSWEHFIHNALAIALGTLIATPAFTLTLANGRRWLATTPWQCWAEGACLALVLVTVNQLAFTTNTRSAAALLYAPLPLLVWAAVRFGLAGLCWSLLALAIQASWGALHERGPFSGHAAPQNVQQLQLFLFAVALPLMLLAVVMQNWRQAASALRDREQEARSSYAQLATIYRTAPVGLLFLDTQLRFVGINDYLAGINGLPAGEHVGRTLREVVPALADQLEPLYRRVIETGQPIVDKEVHGTVSSTPGVERVWLASYYPVSDDAGVLLGVNAVVQEVTERKRSEEALRQSEELYREVVDAQSEMICRYLPDTTLTFVNKAYCRCFGRRREDLVGRSFLELLPPAVREEALNHVRSLAREPRVTTYQHEVVLPDGSVGWQEWVDHAICGASGEVAEFQGIGRDITTHKRDEAALRASYARIQELAGRLITAQEAERARIARELHDDVNQQVAAMAIALSAIKGRLPAGSELGRELSDVQGRAGQLAEDIRNLSHELHPGVLRHAGLAAALQAYCNEFRTRHGLALTLRVDEELDPVPPDAALCLYRVTQEALGNIARHSGARNVQISLKRDAEGLELVIRDDGRGFDPAAAHLAGGIGLISLDERVRLAGGIVRIDAKPQQGSTIFVLIPPEGEEDGTRLSTASG